jgi:hypothetical protein
VEWRSSRPLAVGSELGFVGEFLGRRLAYTYVVKAFEPGERLVLTTAQGPFPMETTYAWRDDDAGATTMTLETKANPPGSRASARR